MGRQSEPVRSETVGLDDFRTGGHVTFMDAEQHLRLGQTEFLVALVDEDTVLVDGRTHRAIAHEGPPLLFPPLT